VTGLTQEAVPITTSEKAGAIVIDGNNAMGQIGGRFAMERAIEKAQQTGIAFAALGGSNHCGVMDYYSMMAIEQDMIGIAGINVLPTMAPWGGVDKIVGLNPLSVVFPALDHFRRFLNRLKCPNSLILPQIHAAGNVLRDLTRHLCPPVI